MGNIEHRTSNAEYRAVHGDNERSSHGQCGSHRERALTEDKCDSPVQPQKNSDSPDVVSCGERDNIVPGALRATQFFLARRGRCFDGWTASRIFQYVHWHLLNGTLFVAWQVEHEMSRVREIIPQFGGLAVIAWPDNALKIRALAAYGVPQFVWQELPQDGDSILIADVVGNRALMPEILKQVMARWAAAPPAIFQKRLFTYRRGKLVELSWETVLRFGRAALPRRPNFQSIARPINVVQCSRRVTTHAEGLVRAEQELCPTESNQTAAGRRCMPVALPPPPELNRRKS